MVAEPADSRWIATVDGRRLAKADDGETLTFDLGSASGRLSVEPAPHGWRLVLHIVIFLGLALLAAPTLGGQSQAKRGLE